MADMYIRPFPHVVRIEPAAACNLACSHCPTGTVQMARGIMKLETFARVLESIRENLETVKVVVLYHGGEPLLNKHFGEMVRQIKYLGVPFVKTVSNGMLLTEATLDSIVNSGLDSIEFSLDGNTPEENNFIRRNCDYETVVKNIKRLIDYKRERKSELPKIYISSIQFLKKDLPVKSQTPTAPDFIVNEFSGEYAGEITGFKCTLAMKWSHMKVLDDIYEVYPDPADIEVSNYCDHVESTVTIRWNGDVVSCCYDLTSQYVLGNVNQEKLSSIWNGKKYQGLRKSIDTMRFIPLCAGCNVVKPNIYLIPRQEVLMRLRKNN